MNKISYDLWINRDGNLMFVSFQYCYFIEGVFGDVAPRIEEIYYLLYSEDGKTFKTNFNQEFE